jgi:predicted AlkP superfamily phosphohydrolase/phosphomutase
LVTAYGNPQGGINSPTLYNLPGNKLLVIRNPDDDQNIFGVLFADDTAADIIGRDVMIMRDALQYKIEEVINWAGQNVLKISSSKSHVFFF